MPRYIDADELKERLQDFSKWCRDGRKQGVDFVLDCPLPDIPKADVVPRSEVEELQKTCDLFSETIKEMDKEIERLKVSDASKEECTIRQHCEIKELKAELSKAKQEVARAILEEFEDGLEIMHFRAKITGDIMFYWKTLKAELEKKYIGE